MLGLILSLIIVGLIAGALARLIVPGKQDISLVMTIVLGIVGSFVGGFLGSIIGAIIVLLLYTRFAGGRSRR